MSDDPDVPCEFCGKSLPASRAVWMQDETACCPSCHPDRASVASLKSHPMTDEERARELAETWMPAEWERAAYHAFLEAFSDIRADQREKCAQVVEAESGDEEPTADIDIGYDMAIVHAATAIRAMGDKGNG